MKSADFRILANEQDITAQIRDRLIQLTVYDTSGLQSDTLSIVLDNRNDAIAFPSTGASLQVYIGYANEDLEYKGVYEVDELQDSLDSDELSIHAKAARMKGSLKAPKDASYDDITFEELVGLIADNHQYGVAISKELASIKFAHINQKGEGDLNLLTRLAREHNAIAKPVNDKLVIVPKGKAASVSGQPLPALTISDRANSSGRVTIHERTEYQSVIAYWFDEATQSRVPVTQGSGEPAYTIRNDFDDAEKAEYAALSKLELLRRGKANLTLTRPLTPQIVPESVITLVDHKPSVDGPWIVEDVTHVIGSQGTSYSACSAVTQA